MSKARIKQHLWEILAILLALGLGVLVISTLQARRSSADDIAHARARNELRVLLAALNGYQQEQQALPTTQAGLQALRGAGILPHVPLDPWGRPYIYRNPGRLREFDLLSTGPDGIESEDDIAIWRLYGQP